MIREEAELNKLKTLITIQTTTQNVYEENIKNIVDVNSPAYKAYSALIKDSLNALEKLESDLRRFEKQLEIYEQNYNGICVPCGKCKYIDSVFPL